MPRAKSTAQNSSESQETVNSTNLAQLNDKMKNKNKQTRFPVVCR